jgi:hypothetical protein
MPNVKYADMLRDNPELLLVYNDYVRICWLTDDKPITLDDFHQLLVDAECKGKPLESEGQRERAVNMLKVTFYLGADIQGTGYVTNNFFGLWLSTFAKSFPGFTVTLGRGYWKGLSEDVRIVTAIVEDKQSNVDEMKRLAEVYKRFFNQDAIGLEMQQVRWELV